MRAMWDRQQSGDSNRHIIGERNRDVRAPICRHDFEARLNVVGQSIHKQHLERLEAILAEIDDLIIGPGVKGRQSEPTPPFEPAC